MYVPIALSALEWWSGATPADWLIPGMVPRFADLIGALAGLDCDQQGIAITPRDPCDPWNRPFNHPRIWLAFGYLGFGTAQMPALGVLMGSAALAVLLWWMAPRSWKEALLVLAMLASPPVLLAIERGNNDLVILLMVFAAVALLAREKASGYVVLYAAFVLKLFPMFSFARAALAPARERRWLIPLLGLGAALYLGLIRGQLVEIARATPHDMFWSFGASVLPMQAAARGWLAPGSVQSAGLISTAALFLTTFVWGMRRAWPAPAEPAAAVGFDIGALVYAGTFMLGSNYDYRLVFLLLCWPAWLDYAAREAGSVRTVARVALTLALCGFWLMPLALEGLPLLALGALCMAGLGARFRPVLREALKLDSPDKVRTA